MGAARRPLGARWQRDAPALLPAVVAATILSSLPAQLQEHPESSRPRPEPTPCLQPHARWSRAPAGSSRESPRAPWLWLSRAQGTSSFDEPITEPALRLPTGSRKVLFVTGCWKGHGVLLPLLFLARALSPSDGKRSVRWTPDEPSRCGRVPGAWPWGRWERYGEDAPCLPTPPGPSSGTRETAAGRGEPCAIGFTGKEWKFGDARGISVVQTRRSWVWPGCHRH